MTDQEIIIEVAKLDGKENPTYSMGEWRHYPPAGGNLPRTPMTFDADYLTSRDAIIRVIEKHDLAEGFVVKFINHLRDLIAHSQDCSDGPIKVISYDLIIATPKQLCIALLMASGKWNY